MSIKATKTPIATLWKKWVSPKKFFHIGEPNISENEMVFRFRASHNVRRGRPPAIQRPNEDVSPADITRVVDAPFNKALLDLGFERASDKLWVRRDLAPICHIFSLERYGSGGSSISPAFGLSLDFVPHVSSGTVKWHRTLKSAKYDLRVETHSRWFDVNTYGNLTTIEEDAAFLLPRALKMGYDFWEQASDLEEVADRFEWHEGWHLRRFKNKVPYSRFIKPSPAAAFLSAKLGNRSKAVKQLDEWLEIERRTQEYEISPEVSLKLHKLLENTFPI